MKSRVVPALGQSCSLGLVLSSTIPFLSVDREGRECLDIHMYVEPYVACRHRKIYVLTGWM